MFSPLLKLLGYNTTEVKPKDPDITLPKLHSSDISPMQSQSFGTFPIKLQSSSTTSMEQESYDIPSVKQKSYDIPSVKQRSYDIPSVKQRSYDIPSVKQRSYDIPSVKQKIYDIPSVKQESYDIPSVKQESYDIPSVKQKNYDIISAKWKSFDISSMKQKYDDIPSMKQQRCDLSVKQKSYDTTSVKQLSYDIPSVKVRSPDTMLLSLQRSDSSSKLPSSSSTPSSILPGFTAISFMKSSSVVKQMKLEDSSTTQVKLSSSDSTSDTVGLQSYRTTTEAVLNSGTTEVKIQDLNKTPENLQHFDIGNISIVNSDTSAVKPKIFTPAELQASTNEPMKLRRIAATLVKKPQDSGNTTTTMPSMIYSEPATSSLDESSSPSCSQVPFNAPEPKRARVDLGRGNTEDACIETPLTHSELTKVCTFRKIMNDETLSETPVTEEQKAPLTRFGLTDRLAFRKSWNKEAQSEACTTKEEAPPTRKLPESRSFRKSMSEEAQLKVPITREEASLTCCKLPEGSSLRKSSSDEVETCSSRIFDKRKPDVDRNLDEKAPTTSQKNFSKSSAVRKWPKLKPIEKQNNDSLSKKNIEHNIRFQSKKKPASKPRNYNLFEESRNKIDHTKRSFQPKVLESGSQTRSPVVYARLREVSQNPEDIVEIVEKCLFAEKGIGEIKPLPDHNGKKTIVAIHCSNQEVVQIVKMELGKGDLQSQTRIWCFDTFDRAVSWGIRSGVEKEMSSKSYLGEVMWNADEALRKHQVKILEVEQQMTAKKHKKKNKHMFMTAYMENQNLILALEEKEKELKLQRIEFVKYTGNQTEDLKKAKESPSFETSAKKIKADVSLECHRLCNALPIYARRSDILATVQNNQVCVIIGETGSGKSTQMAQYFYQAGLAEAGMIACTQPRKIAATSLATHVAREMTTSVGQVVGYKVGMQMRKADSTKILYMTDHILLNECLQDRNLSAYSFIIIDEAHERSIHTDLLLGMIKTCLTNRPELKVVITSATINPDIFVEYFGQCPVLKVSGRMFPVEVIWERQVDDLDSFGNYQEKAVQKAIEVHLYEEAGDILVFLTKPAETEKCSERFKSLMKGNKSNFVVLQLHGRLQSDEQQKIFNPPPRGIRKIVFATNSAETSVTIPGIKYVIDTGLVNEKAFDPVRKMSTLAVAPVTQSSAQQRKGRAGRLASGKCYRLYSQQVFQNMSTNSLPEILKVHIGHAILKLMELDVNPMEFDFIEAPSDVALQEAFTSLIHIGAVADNSITKLGKWIAKMPFDPQYGRFVYEAVQGCVAVEAIVVAVASGSGSVFYRGGTNEQRDLADKHKLQFCHEKGDQMTALNVFREWHKVEMMEKGKWCVQNSVNGKSMKRIQETTKEVLDILKKELNTEIDFTFAEKEIVDDQLPELLLKALSRNLSHCLGCRNASYTIVSEHRQVELHPSSSLVILGSQPEWIVFDQIMKMTKEFAMEVTTIPESLLEKGVEEGWLDVRIEEAKEGQLSTVIKEYVGPQLFRKFVGPLYANFKAFEARLATQYPESVVKVETNEDLGEIKMLSSEDKKEQLVDCLSGTLKRYKTEIENEISEEKIGSSADCPRAVISNGGTTLDMPLPGEYNDVVVSYPAVQYPALRRICMATHDVVRDFEKYGKIKQCVPFNLTNSSIWGKVVYENAKAASAAVKETARIRGPKAHASNNVNYNQTKFTAKITYFTVVTEENQHQQKLQEKLQEFSHPDNFNIVKENACHSFHVTKKKIRTWTWHCSFSNPVEGEAACRAIDNIFSVDEQIVSMKPDICSSLLINREIYQQYQEELKVQIQEMENDNVTIKWLKLKNNGVTLQLHTRSIDELKHIQTAIQHLVKGEVMKCEENPALLALFSREGCRALHNIKRNAKTLIMKDDRVMSVAIHGKKGQRLAAKGLVVKCAEQLVKERDLHEVELRGVGKPVGLMKALVAKYHLDLGVLVTKTGLETVRLNPRLQKLTLSGSQESVTKAKALIGEIVTSLTADGAVLQHGDTPVCVICSCVVEVKALYRLECCGHPYCQECVERLLEKTLATRKFPIVCFHPDCPTKFAWKDFINLSRLGHLKIADLVSSSVSAYVIQHKDILRFCLTPNCPAVYRVSQTGPHLSTCPECCARICSSCHVHYHDGIPCAP